MEPFADVDFVERLSSWGDTPALLTDTATVSYRELDTRVSAAADRIGSSRHLVLLAARPSVETIISYLACVRGHHPVLVVDPDRGERWRDVVDRFEPDLVIDPGGALCPNGSSDGWQRRRTGARHALHRDLRLLLSTSGSTGSPKLARLSASNLSSNAAAIAAYLQLTAQDRAITNLPLSYCFGLSVVHSHLAVGAGVVVSDLSVTDPGFLPLARDKRVTSLSGVPHTFALLDRSGRRWEELPSLRFVAQAGGRLPPDDVLRLAELGRRNGWQLFVMYGQTEATARMAYLDPREVRSHPGSIGRPIPGGRLQLASTDGNGVGELVYTGPNVMMGYAHAASDLGRSAELGELRTGDLARRDEAGRFHIVGRASRFAKLLGHRIDLEQVQQALIPYDRLAVCVSDDQRLIVAATTGEPDLLRRRAAKLTGLPPALIAVRRYEEIPRLPNGKPDLLALTAVQPRPDNPADVLTTLRRTYAEALGYDRVPVDSTFVRLGGDSLSFVEVSLRLEETLGALPDRWPELTLRELADLRRPDQDAAGESPPKPQPARRSRWRKAARVDTAAALRAVAITLVVLSHLEITPVRGGAHLLLGLAGYGFARFQLSAIRQTDRVLGLAHSVARVALPSILFIGLVVLVSGNYSLANVFLLNHYLGPPKWTETWNFWFVEALVEILLAVLALLAIPAVRRFERRFTVLLPALLLTAGLLVRYDVFGWAPDSMQYGRPYAIAWLFALGWLIQRATSIPARLAVSGIVLLTLTGYFPEEPTRAAVVQAGLLLVLWTTAVPLPRGLAPVVRVVASASLWIYLTHWVVWPFLQERVGLTVAAVAICCLIAGAATTALLAHGRRVFGRAGDWLVTALRWNRPLSAPPIGSWGRRVLVQSRD